MSHCHLPKFHVIFVLICCHSMSCNFHFMSLWSSYNFISHRCRLHCSQECREAFNQWRPRLLEKINNFVNIVQIWLSSEMISEVRITWHWPDQERRRDWCQKLGRFGVLASKSTMARQAFEAHSKLLLTLESGQSLPLWWHTIQAQKKTDSQQPKNDIKNCVRNSWSAGLPCFAGLTLDSVWHLGGKSQGDDQSQ